MMVAWAMWVMTALLLIVGQLAGDLHLSFVEERRAQERCELRAAAISGLEAYRLLLVSVSNPDYGHLQETYRADPALAIFRPAAGIRSIIYHVSEVAEPFPLVFGAADEESRLNILRAGVEEISRLPGVSAPMAQNLSSYLAGQPKPPPQSLAELMKVPGWEFLEADKLQRLITFFGDGRININTASVETLELLGLSARVTGDLARFLSGPDGERGGGDDRYFKGISEIEPRLRESGMSESDLGELLALVHAERLTVKSWHYRIRSRAVREATGSQYEIDAIIKADEKGSILSWKEIQPS